MNLADPELEYIDPTPDIHNLFVHFDKIFFWTSLISRSLVRWSKRMYSCAGICSYEGRNGICNITLSEPLLKLRPRKDLVETLLHEMIHAYLFITNRDNDRDGHGPNFQAHMHRINKIAGINISIYHDFHDEVKLYLTHWWRCNGPCQKRKPYFGIVRRFSNRAPGLKDFWWESHRRSCGGTFIKIKEPENVKKQSSKSKETEKSKDNRKQINIDTYVDKTKVLTKTDSTLTAGVYRGKILATITNSNNVNSVTEKVREVWRDKQLPTTINGLNSKLPNKNIPIAKPNKHKINETLESPAKKVKKIEDYFKATASSIFKDVYGKECEVIISSSNKFKVIAGNECTERNKVNQSENNNDLVDCPSCNAKVNSAKINTHLDECLNNEIIKELTQVPPKLCCNTTVGPSTNKIDNKNTFIQIETIQNNHPYETAHNSFKIIDGEIKKEKEYFGDNKPTNLCSENQPDSTFIKIDDYLNKIKKDPDCSDIDSIQACPCCGYRGHKSVDEHLEECPAFKNNTVRPGSKPGESSSAVIDTIVIDDDEFDETLTFNPSGTKTPCPCCLDMIEIADMNDHLDVCLNT